MDILKNISAIMEAKRLLQKDIAIGMGLSISAISHLLNGSRELKVKDLDKIAKALEVEVIDLFTYPDKYKKSESDTTSVEIHNTQKNEENPYKLLYELQKEMMDLFQENEKLKKHSVKMSTANVG